MNVFLIAAPSALQQALCHWFEMRGRAFQQVLPAAVPELGQGDLAGSIVVEIATLDAFQRGQELALSGDDRHGLLDQARLAGAPVLFLSDGRVFDGDYAPINHREADKVQPGSIPGARLAAVEHLLERQLEQYLVLRTGPLFSEVGDNFFTGLFADLVRGGEIALNSGLKTCPTHVADLARVVSAVVDQISCGAQNWGSYHYNSSGQTSAYEFTEVMLAFASQQLDLEKRKTSLRSAEAGQRIEPAVPVLRCEKILHDFGIKQLPWRSYLPQPIKVLCEAKQK
ncbi:sugar nucleotide-binding protein [Litorivivens sp.]|uniref:sugar nucleotide-binding protein n=1 Tax=Litorivivens sp. TaxID=2020868 RepID=UPI0035643B05